MVVSERGHGTQKSLSVTGITRGDVRSNRVVKKSFVSRPGEYHHKCYAALSVVRSAHDSHSECRSSAGAGGGGGSHGGVAGGSGLGWSGRSGFTHGYYPRYRPFRNYGWGLSSWYYPYWDEGEPLESYPEAESSVTSPPVAVPSVVIVESHDYRPPAAAPEGPKLIEVPETKGPATTTKPQPPTLFVFANGARLEARRYMLTADSLCVEIGRQQRRISLGKIDVDATIAANRERGIDLKFPTDRNEIFLGF